MEIIYYYLWKLFNLFIIYGNYLVSMEIIYYYLWKLFNLFIIYGNYLFSSMKII